MPTIEEIRQQQAAAQAATDQALQSGFGGVFGLHGKALQRQIAIERAREQEQAIGEQLQQAQMDQAETFAAAAAIRAEDFGTLQNLNTQVRGGITAQQAAQNFLASDPQRLQFEAEQRLIEGKRAAADLVAQQLSNRQTRAGLDAGVLGMTGDQVQGMITGMQTKFLQQMAAPQQVMDAFQQIEFFLAAEDAAGTQAAIIKLAKILDPTSVVREGEVTTIEGGLGIGNQLVTQFNRAFNKGASPEAADAIRRTAYSAAAPVMQRALKQRQEFEGAAELLFGESFPGIGRVTTGAGLDWDQMALLFMTGRVDGKEPQTGQRVVDFNSLSGAR